MTQRAKPKKSDIFLTLSKTFLFAFEFQLCRAWSILIFAINQLKAVAKFSKFGSNFSKLKKKEIQIQSKMEGNPEESEPK